MADIEKLRTRLTEAEDAYHKLMTGEREVEVEYAGSRRVRFSDANADALRRYIAELKAEIAKRLCPYRGPVGFIF